MPERDDLDRLIDSELASYAEPRPGLEKRVLANVSIETERPRRRRAVTAILVSLAVSLLLVAIVMMRTPHSQREQMAHTPAPKSLPEVVAPVPHDSSRLLAETHVQKHNRAPAQQRRSAHPLPKLDLFPTLHPLSEEEQAVTTFATQAREADRQALVAARQRLDEPVNITAINISPLPSQEQNEN